MKYFLVILLVSFSSLLVAQTQPAAVPLAGQALLDSMVREAVSGTYKDKEDTNKVKLLCLIAFRYSYIDADQGLLYGAKAQVLAQKLNWTKGIGEAYHSFGVNYLSKSDHAKAIENWMKALAISRSQGNKRGILSITNNLGIIHYRMGDFPGALENFFAALTIAEELDDKDRVGSLYSNISGVYSELGNESKSLEYSVKSLELAKVVGKEDGIANALGSLGNKYHFTKQYDSALSYNRQSLRMYEELGNKEGIARLLANIGTAYLGKNKHRAGLEYGLRGLKVYQEVGSKYGVAGASELIGEIYLSAARDSNLHSADVDQMVVPGTVAGNAGPGKRAALLVAADRYLGQAIAIYEELEAIDELKECYFSLSEVRILTGNFRGALESYKQYTILKDSIFSTATNVKIANLGTKRELDLKESHIKILSQENNLKDLRAARDKQTRRALVAGIVMMVVIAFSLVMYYVRRQRSDKMIANERINTLLKDQELQSVSSMLEVQEQERRRIAADLHDRLGSMLSTVKLYFNSVEEQIDTLKEQNKEQYHKATSLLDDACDEVRKISHNLVSGELVKFGLVSALNQLKETIENSGILKMNVYAFGMEERLDSAIEISLYRVAQELMNNMMKHAKATEVTIQLNRVNNNLNIVVEDNGVGFDVDAALAKDGMGLKNIETRVKKMNGIVMFDSGKGRGTTTIIDIPV